MSLKARLLFAIVALLVVAVVIQAVTSLTLSVSSSTASLREASRDKLILQSVQTREAIDDYLSVVSDQVKNQSSSSLFSAAASTFINAYNRYDSQRNPLSSSARTALNRYYTESFVERYEARNTGTVNNPLRLVEPLSSTAKKLQYDFIAGSSYPIGEKDSLVDLNNATEYAAAHSQYHAEIRRFLKTFGYYDIFIADPDTGNIVYSVYKELDFATSVSTGPYAKTGIGEAFRLAKRAGSDAVVTSELLTYLPSYDAMAGFVASPITDARGRQQAILIFQIPLDVFSSILTQDQDWQARGFGASGETYLVSPEKLLVNESRFFVEDRQAYLAAISKKYSEAAALIEDADTSIGTQPVNSGAANAALAGETGFTEINDYRDVAVFSYYAPLQIGNYTYALLSEIDVEEALAPAASLKRTIASSTLITSVIIIIIAVVVALWLANLLVKPLTRLGDACRDLSRGDGDLTVRLPASSIPEVDRIIRPFNEFISQVHDVVSNIHRNADVIASASEELSVTMQQSKQLSVEQRDESHMVASSVEELSASIADVSRATAETRDQGISARTSLKENMERTNLAAENIKLLVGLLTKSSAVINTLKEEVNQITGLLNDITAIADQTNLLALNAAIEAARAGEAGRGFSVVADEVRALATRSQNSTEEIAKIVDSMNKSSENSVKEMEKATAAADGGIHLVDLVSTAMNELSEIIEQVQQMAESVAGATEEQEATSKSVSQNVTRISDMAGEIDTAAQQSNQAAQELAEVASTSKELVSRFKL